MSNSHDASQSSVTSPSHSPSSPEVARCPPAGLSQTQISWKTIVEIRKVVPTMNWLPSADRSEVSRVFAVYLKRVNSARSSAEQSLAVKYLYALPTAILRRSGRKEPSRRNRRSLSLALRERCRRALNWELHGLLTEARDAFTAISRPQQLRSPPINSNSTYRRARARAEKGEYRRAISALLSQPLADTSDLDVQTQLERLHPPPATPVIPVAHLESLAPAPRISASDVLKAIYRFDRTSAAGPDGLYPAILQTLLKSSHGETPSTISQWSSRSSCRIS